MDCTICATERSRRATVSASCCSTRGGGILPEDRVGGDGSGRRPGAPSSPVGGRSRRLVDGRAEGHDSEADFDAPDADPEVSVSHRGRCARERRSVVRRTSFAKLRDRWELYHGRPIRRCRSGPQGRGRERPAYSACLIRHGDDWDVRCPSLPPPGVAPGPTVPCGKATAIRAGIVPGPARRCRTARRPAGRRTGAPPPRSGARTAFPRRDHWSGSDPRGRGRGCANAPGPEPAAVPWTGGSLPAPPERALRPRPPGTIGHKTLARSGLRRPAGAHIGSSGVRIGTPCRFRGPVRL